MTAFISDRPIRVGIVDDHEAYRSILHSTLESLPNIEVVAEAQNGVEGISMVEFARPDVVLMDINMPVLDGIEATRIIRSNFSDTNVIILTMYAHRIYSDNALQAGACQVLTKDCSKEILLDAIKECSPGPFRVVGHPPH
jgi:two-component system nitrate/nitrite response regulator NarL